MGAGGGGTADAQEPSKRHVVIGRVIDTGGHGLSHASVGLGSLQQRTSDDGAFIFNSVAPGVYAISVLRVGYATSRDTLTVGGEDTTRVQIVLRAVELDTVRVAATNSRIAAFEERRLRGGGYYVSRAELERAGGKNMGDVLRRVPGLRIMTDGTGRGELYAVNARGAITLRGANPKCYVQVYIDDVPVFSGGPQPPYNLKQLTAEEVEAIEFYQGGASVPAQYNRTGSACGVLLLWTRR